jgi:hypothetical protein
MFGRNGATKKMVAMGASACQERPLERHWQGTSVSFRFTRERGNNLSYEYTFRLGQIRDKPYPILTLFRLKSERQIDVSRAAVPITYLWRANDFWDDLN